MDYSAYLEKLANILSKLEGGRSKCMVTLK